MDIVVVSDVEVCNLAFNGKFVELRGVARQFEETNWWQLNTADKNGKVALHHAIEGVVMGRIDIDVCKNIVKLLLDRGANPNSTDRNGQTPLMWVEWTRMRVIVDLLIDHGADVNTIDNDGRSALTYAVTTFSPDPEIVAELFGHSHDRRMFYPPLTQQDVLLQDNDGRTALSYAAEPCCPIEIGLKILDVYPIPVGGGIRDWIAREGLDVQNFLFPEHRVNANDERLYWAARKGHVDVIEHLLQHGANVNTTDKCQRTALHLAASGGHVDAVRCLLEHNAQMNATDMVRKTALHWAAMLGSDNVVSHLLGKGAEVDARDEKGKTPLHWVAVWGRDNVVSHLLEKGAKVDARDEDEKTPLHYAVRRGHDKVMSHLLEKGAQVDAMDKDGKTPLHYAAFREYWTCRNDNAVANLLENGAQVNARDKNGQLALHYAAVCGSLADVKCLLVHKAEIDARDKDGKTALELAKDSRNVHVVEFLQRASDEVGKTALHWAAKEGHGKVVAHLLEKGAEVDASDKESYESKPQTSQTAETGIDPLPLEKLEESLEKQKESYESGPYLALVGCVCPDAEIGEAEIEHWSLEKSEEISMKQKESYESKPQTSQTPEAEIEHLPLGKPEEISKEQKISEARSLALRFMVKNPCCIRVIPYENGNGTLTMRLYIDADGKGIPKDVRNAGDKIFANYEIEYEDLQEPRLSKIVTELPSSIKKTGKNSDLSRKIWENVHVFDNRLNVTAVCASYKIIDCKEVDTPCVTVFVLGKNRIPAGESDIEEIKRNKGGLFDNAKFDVVEGYFKPAHGTEYTSYAHYLRGGVGISARGARSAGTLGGFLVDKNGNVYILSNEHVLNPPEVKNMKDIVIEQPAQSDYEKKMEYAKKNVEECKGRKSKLEKAEYKYEEKKPLYREKMEDCEQKIKDAQKNYEEIEKRKPRKIGTYISGLQDNVNVRLGGKDVRVFVDAAIAQLDSDELEMVTISSEAETCPLYGFTNINDEDKKFTPDGKTGDMEALRDQEKLHFMKIGQSSGLTWNGEFDLSMEEMYVSCIGAPFNNIPLVLCENCIEMFSSEQDKSKEENSEDEECRKCGKPLNRKNDEDGAKDSVWSLWAHNVFVIRKNETPFCKAGDSGALVFGNDDRAWGLLFGRFRHRLKNTVYCLSSPLCVALKALEDKSGIKGLELWCVEERNEENEEAMKTEVNEEAMQTEVNEEMMHWN